MASRAMAVWVGRPPMDAPGGQQSWWLTDTRAQRRQSSSGRSAVRKLPNRKVARVFGSQRFSCAINERKNARAHGRTDSAVGRQEPVKQRFITGVSGRVLSVLRWLVVGGVLIYLALGEYGEDLAGR